MRVQTDVSEVMEASLARANAAEEREADDQNTGDDLTGAWALNPNPAT